MPSTNVTKIAHIADCHLRSAQYGFRTRGKDFFEGMKNAVQAAIDAGVDGILCSGDVIDTAYPSAAIIKEQLPAIQRMLVAAGIPMLVISGNHDLTSPHWCDQMGEQADGAGIEVIDHALATIGGVSVYGIPFCHPDELREQLNSPDLPEADILMWHGEIKEFVGYPRQNVIEMADFPSGKFQLVAMGDQHIHKQIVREEDGLVVAYPGSTELCSTAEDGQKKMFVYTFEGGKISGIESVKFATRPVQRFRLETEIDVEQAIPEIIPGSLVFVEYNRLLAGIIPRLSAAMDPTNILQATMLPEVREDITRKARESAEALPTLSQYMSDQLQHVASPEERERLEGLCCALVDASQDHKGTIDRFIEDRLGGKINL